MLVVGCSLLAVGRWALRVLVECRLVFVVGRWLLVVCCLLGVVGCVFPGSLFVVPCVLFVVCCFGVC